MSVQAESRALDRFEDDFVQEVVIAERGPKARQASSRKVGVYLDGIFTTISEDTLDFLIEIGFLVVTKRKPF